MNNSSAHRSLRSALYDLGETAPSEAELDAARDVEHVSLLLPSWERFDAAGAAGYAARWTDAELASGLRAASVRLRDERAARATRLHNALVHGMKLYTASSVPAYHAARDLDRILRAEAARRVSEYRRAASELARLLR